MAGKPRTRSREAIERAAIDAARRQLAAGGVAGVSWRGIAKAVDLGPASLYTYFSGIDALFTAVLLDSYGRLSGFVEAAVAAHAAAPIGDRLLCGPLAYRAWALAHPQEFNLLFTDQLPGYAAPPGGPTVGAQVAVFDPMARVLAEAGGRPLPGGAAAARGEGVQRFLGLWGLFHGLTSLEANHHLDWVDAEATFLRHVRAALDALGLPPAGPRFPGRFRRWAAAALAAST